MDIQKVEVSTIAGRPPKDDSRDKQYRSISLKRSIECPYCGAGNNMDFTEYCEITSDERQMGAETEYSFDREDHSCISCGKVFRVYGSIWEYPVGALNNQNIHVEPLEDDEDDEDE